MEKLQVIDNFLPEDQFKILSKALISYNFGWSYCDWVSSEESKNDDEYYFEHMFYNNHHPQSNYFELIIPILEKLDVKSLIRAKANMYPNSGKELLKNSFHKDYDFPHKGAVFYVNSNNGYTGFQDGTKIDSIENRILLFDSSVLHHSTHCTDRKVRLTINFNYF